MAGGLHPPISVILTWSPNYIDPERRNWLVVILATVLLVLCYIVVSLRIWARFFIAKNAGIDDALIIFNMVCINMYTMHSWSSLDPDSFDGIVNNIESWSAL